MGPLGLFGSRPGRTPTPGPRPRADSGDKNPKETSCEPRIRRTNRRPESGNAGGGAEARGAPASPAGSSKALTPGRAVGAEPQRRRQRSRSSGRPTGAPALRCQTTTQHPRVGRGLAVLPGRILGPAPHSARRSGLRRRPELHGAPRTLRIAPRKDSDPRPAAESGLRRQEPEGDELRAPDPANEPTAGVRERWWRRGGERGPGEPGWFFEGFDSRASRGSRAAAPPPAFPELRPTHRRQSSSFTRRREAWTGARRRRRCRRGPGRCRRAWRR